MMMWKTVTSAIVFASAVCSGTASLQDISYMKAVTNDLPNGVDLNVTAVENSGLGISYWSGYEAILKDQKGSNQIGGSGGSSFEFHSYGTTVRDITVYGGGVHGGFHAMVVVLFDDTRGVYGDLTSAGNPIETFTFAPGETISGDLVVSGNGIGTRTGYLYFKTNKGNTFEAGDSGHDHYNYPANGRFITGFFGKHGSDIDALGTYFTKPIESTALSNMKYPSLNLNSEICQPPTQISATHVTNPNPIGTLPTSVVLSYSKLSGSNNCWTTTTSLSFGQSYKITGGVPFVAGGEATTTWSIQQQFGFNGCSNSQTTVTETQTIYVPPQKDCTVYVTQCQGHLDSVPYTASMTMNFSDGSDSYTMSVSGSYSGADALVADVSPDCKDM